MSDPHERLSIMPDSRRGFLGEFAFAAEIPRWAHEQIQRAARKKALEDADRWLGEVLGEKLWSSVDRFAMEYVMRLREEIEKES